MTLREFLDVAYYVLVENVQRGVQAGPGIFEALDQMGQWGASPVAPVPVVESDNDRALAEFESMISGLRSGGIGG